MKATTHSKFNLQKKPTLILAWIPWILYFSFLLCLIETFSFFCFYFLKDHLKFAGNNGLKVKKTLPFDANLGWRSFGDRELDGVNAHISFFGDSFTFGDEVALTETWTYLLNKKHGISTANYGVSGFGTDQALLMYESIFKESKSKYFVLCFISENIRRNLNVYRPFVNPSTLLRYSKPRFSLNGDEIVFLPNPIQTEKDLSLLNNSDFLEKIGKNDFWYIPNMPPNNFPYTRILLHKSFWTQVFDFASTRGNPYRRLSVPRVWQNKTALKIQKHIFKEFVKHRPSKNGTSILLHLPTVYEIEDYTLSSIIPISITETKKFCMREKIICWFPLIDLPRYKSESLKLLFRPYGHYSYLGSQILAEYISEKLLELEKDDSH